METVTLVLPLFALIFIGYGLRKSGFFSPQFATDVNKLVYYVALPAAIIAEMFAATPAELAQPQLVIGFPLVVLGTIAVAVLLSAAMRREQRGAFAQLCYRANLAYFGLPIVTTALGPQSFGYAGVIVGIGLIINSVFTVVVLKLLAPDRDESSISSHLAAILRNPIIVALAIGLAVSFAGAAIPPIILRVLQLLGRTSLPLVLLVVGFSLSFSQIRNSLGVNIAAALIKLLVMPAIAYVVIGVAFGTTGLIRDVVVLMAAMPTSTISQSFAARFGADEQMTAAGVSLSTLAAMLTIPLWLALI